MPMDNNGMLQPRQYLHSMDTMSCPDARLDRPICNSVRKGSRGQGVFTMLLNPDGIFMCHQYLRRDRSDDISPHQPPRYPPVAPK